MSIETARKRLSIRSWRRGTKELDLILGRFSDENLFKLDMSELDLYEQLLSNDDHLIHGIGLHWHIGSRAVSRTVKQLGWWSDRQTAGRAATWMGGWADGQAIGGPKLIVLSKIPSTQIAKRWNILIPQTGACDYGVLASNLIIG